MLFGIALAKPYFTNKPVNIDELKTELSKLLPSHDLLTKQGTPSRIIVSLDGIQKAIVVMDTPKPEYLMGGLTIFTANKSAHLRPIAQKIQQLDLIKQ